jgi:hypothetical protein
VKANLNDEQKALVRQVNSLVFCLRQIAKCTTSSYSAADFAVRFGRLYDKVIPSKTWRKVAEQAQRKWAETVPLVHEMAELLRQCRQDEDETKRKAHALANEMLGVARRIQGACARVDYSDRILLLSIEKENAPTYLKPEYDAAIARLRKASSGSRESENENDN